MVFFRQPTTLYPNLLFQPFSWSAWVGVFISMSIIAICIGLVEYYSTIHKCKSRGFNKNIIFGIIGIFAQQGCIIFNSLLRMYKYVNTFGLQAGITKMNIRKEMGMTPMPFLSNLRSPWG